MTQLLRTKNEIAIQMQNRDAEEWDIEILPKNTDQEEAHPPQILPGLKRCASLLLPPHHQQTPFLLSISHSPAQTSNPLLIPLPITSSPISSLFIHSTPTTFPAFATNPPHPLSLSGINAIHINTAMRLESVTASIRFDLKRRGL